MAVKIKKGIKELVAEANAEIQTITVDDALKLKDDPGVTFVDIRDIRELDRDGRIPGAFHAPRGMLEFWVDPASPYYKEIFGSGKKFVFFCAGGMRSALAAQQLLLNGKRSWRPALWLATPWSWFQNFFLRGGFLDGYRGARIAQMAARAVRLKYRKLGQLLEQTAKRDSA